jgi:hypothetical protein
MTTWADENKADVSGTFNTDRETEEAERTVRGRQESSPEPSPLERSKIRNHNRVEEIKSGLPQFDEERSGSDMGDAAGSSDDGVSDNVECD